MRNMALVLMEKSDRSLHLSEGQAEVFVRHCYSDEPSRPSTAGTIICMLWLLHAASKQTSAAAGHPDKC